MRPWREVCPSRPQIQGTVPGTGFGGDKGGRASRDGGTSRALSGGGQGGGEIGRGGCSIKAPEKNMTLGPLLQMIKGATGPVITREERAEEEMVAYLLEPVAHGDDANF